MSKKIVIAGAGGIGRAVALLLREIDWEHSVNIHIGDCNLATAREAADWIRHDSQKPGLTDPFEMPHVGSSFELESVLKGSDILLDCLPGDQAARMAELALKHNIAYANLTEHVAATNKIIQQAKAAQKGFILQTGLAPGFVDVLANHLFSEFCKSYGVEKVESVAMKVGALTMNATSPSYYGFTWSPIGVATEYVEPAIVIRDFKKTTLPSLSERAVIIIDGIAYEEDLTSGGAADLPSSLEGKTRNLDYKTLRYIGHYDWVEKVLSSIPETQNRAKALQKIMEKSIPFVYDGDMVVIYVSVSGYDSQNHLRIMERTYRILPAKVGNQKLKAIQSTTAAGLAESARLLLTGNYKGIVLQSQIPSENFLTGPFISAVYK